MMCYQNYNINTGTNILYKMKRVYGYVRVSTEIQKEKQRLVEFSELKQSENECIACEG